MLVNEGLKILLRLEAHLGVDVEVNSIHFYDPLVEWHIFHCVNLT